MQFVKIHEIERRESLTAMERRKAEGSEGWKEVRLKETAIAKWVLRRHHLPQVSELIYHPVIKDFFHAIHELALCCYIKRIIY